MTQSYLNNKKYTVSLCTLGCKVNQYESQAIAEDFQRLGFSLCDFSEKCDVYVVNTCTVTGESDKKSRQMLRRARKNGGDDAIVIAAGCFSQAQGEKAMSICEADAAFGNADKSKIAVYAFETLRSRRKSSVFDNHILPLSDITEYDEMSITHSDRTRAFVKIVDGCENRCSYCIIPNVRGKIRSRDPDSIINELTILANTGYKEVVLTGIETAAYGRDLDDCSLPKLLKLADDVDGIEQIRLGSLEPTVIKDEFINTICSMRHAVPHFHLSLQSGSDCVLRGMRRKYNTKMFFETISKLREHIPNVTFTTDIIVGFPGETEEMFLETCEFVRKCSFLYIHIFPYSKRDGTDAAVMPEQVAESIKKERAARLKNVMLRARSDVLRTFDGFETTVLFEEKTDDGYFIGHTPHYIEAKLNSKNVDDLSGKICKCRLLFDASTEEYMLCELI